MKSENHPITNVDLDSRLQRLEKRSRFLGAGWALTAALLGGALLIGAGEDAEHPWLTVKGLTVVDDAGNPRAYLGAPVPSLEDATQPSDATGLVLLNTDGAEAASLTTKTSGASMVTVADGKTDRLALVVWPSGESGVYVLGPENMSGYRHQLAVDEDGKTYAIMRSSDGEYIKRIGEPGGGGNGQARSAPPAIPNAGQFNMPGRGGAGAAGMGGFPGAGGAGRGGAGMGGFPGAGGAGAGNAGMGGFPGVGGVGAPGAGEMPDIEEMRRQMIERMNLPPEEKQKLLERMEEQAKLMEERRAAATKAAEEQDQPNAEEDEESDTEDNTDADSDDAKDDDNDSA